MTAIDHYGDLAITAFTDNDPPERSWHEIIPASRPDGSPTLLVQGNELIFGVTSDAPRSNAVTFGDVVIFYTSNELTVRIPIVLV
jgi:hypothetical protein